MLPNEGKFRLLRLNDSTPQDVESLMIISLQLFTSKHRSLI